MTNEQNEKESSEENLFEQMENAPSSVSVKRLQRSRSDVVITGVCAGLAEYFNVDVANVRLVAILSLLLGGWSVAAYLLTAALLPIEQTPKELTDNERIKLHKEHFRVVLSGILILVGFHFALVQIGIISESRLFIFPNNFMFQLLSIAAGIYLIISRRKLEKYSKEPQSNFLRTRDNKIILGVCGGIGKYLNVDETAVRMIFLFATLLTLGLFAVGYIALGTFTDLEEEKKIETQ